MAGIKPWQLFSEVVTVTCDDNQTQTCQKFPYPCSPNLTSSSLTWLLVLMTNSSQSITPTCLAVGTHRWRLPRGTASLRPLPTLFPQAFSSQFRYDILGFSNWPAGNSFSDSPALLLDLYSPSSPHNYLKFLINNNNSKNTRLITITLMSDSAPLSHFEGLCRTELRVYR